MYRDEITGLQLRPKDQPRPRSGHLAQSQTFLAIPKDKEQLDEEIISLKKQLNDERADKALLKTEFNRLREFLGKLKIERMQAAKRKPSIKKNPKNADLNEVLAAEGVAPANNTSTITSSENPDDPTKYRLKITSLKSKISDLNSKINDLTDQISKFKSKTSEEVEYSAKLRKDLLE